MGEGSLKHKMLVVGIVSLFIIISLTPMVIGFDTKHTEHFSEFDETLANLRYIAQLQKVLMTLNTNITKKSY